MKLANKYSNRNKSDFYQTPYSLTRLFLNCNEFNKDMSVLEPCNGNGAISKILKEYNFTNIITNEINDEEGIDFLEWDENNKVEYIITNPPYRLAFEFIQKCKKISNKFALLLPLTYLHGKKRFDNIYNIESYKLEKVFIFTRYPLLTNELYENGKFKTGMMVYAWFLWNKEYTGKPIIEWLDNDSFVLRKKKDKNN